MASRAAAALVRVTSVLALSLFMRAPAYGWAMVKQKSKPEITAHPEKATLVIYRATNYGKPVVVTNYLDGEPIGETKGKTYFITLIEPGRHYVIASSENNACARFDFEAGKVYYLLQAMFPGVMKVRTGFIAKSPEEAMKDIPGLDYLVFNPEKKVKELRQKTYESTVADFEKEVVEKPDRHKDVLEYPGY